jgi:integrase
MNGFLKKRGKYYYAVINLKDSNGKWSKKWISTKETTEREAKKALNQLLSEAQQEKIKVNNVRKSGSRMKFHELMEYWLENVIPGHVEKTTLNGYCTNVNIHIIPYFKELNIKVENLTVLDLDKYINFKLTKGRVDDKGGLSANTVKKQFHNIKMALDYAVDCLNIIENNPALKVKLPKIKKYRPNYYTVNQLEKLVEVTAGTLIESAVFITVHYGFRRGEALGLRWSDINFFDDSLTVKNNRTVGEEKKPKTESSLRTLPLIPVVKEYLLNLKSKQNDEKEFLGKAYIVNDYVCKYPDGKPVNIYTLNHAFSRILAKNNMPHIRFHDLRHSTGSYLIKIGASLKEISEWLGHSDIKTTVIYTHTDAETKRNTATKIQKYFEENKNKQEKNYPSNPNTF